MVVLLLRVVLASAILAIVCLHHPAQGTVLADIFQPFAFSVLGLVLLLFEVRWFISLFLKSYYQGYKDSTFLNFAKVCFLSSSLHLCPLQIYTFNFWKKQVCMYSPNISSYCQAAPFVFMAWSCMYFSPYNFSV